jgi:hypothetical protein
MKSPGKGGDADPFKKPDPEKEPEQAISEPGEPADDLPLIIKIEPAFGKEFIDREDILAALHKISDGLGKEELARVEIRIYGSGALILTYEDSRRITTDLDAVSSEPIVFHLAEKAGNDLGFPDDWFNGDVRMYDRPSLEFVEHRLPGCENIRVMAVTMECLFAMKCFASRDRKDLNDIRFLMDKLGVESLKQAEAIFERFYRQDPMPELGMITVLEACDWRYE